MAAYRAKRRLAYRKKASVSTRRYSRRSAPRRSYGKKRTYRKKTSVSRKSLLNVTSRKKRNGMLSWSNTNSSGVSQTLQQGSAFVLGSRTGVFLFQVSAMDMSSTSGGADTITNQAERTSQTCFMRGYSEHLRIQTNSATPWFHRRICFATRGGSPFTQVNSGDTQVQASGNSVDTTNGMERLWLDGYVNNQGLTIAAQWGVLFKGVSGKDWVDPILAPVDTTRVDLKYDKTFCYRSGNQSGMIKETKFWHPMNKNLVYDDDESGEVEASSYFSVDDKRGMGDYYIMDIVNSGLTGSGSDIINLNSNSTLYWHEK